MERGIVLLATGNGLYVRMALMLACSLKKCSDDIKICLLHDDYINHLNKEEQLIFDIKKPLTNDQARNPFFVKLFINELSPFEETLYLDVDMLWMPFAKVETLFDELSKYDFTIANRGISKSTDWVTWEQDMYDVASEFIYFKKSDAVNELFDKAQMFYLTNDKVNRTIAGVQPDEPAISYAMNELGIIPHKQPYHPSYWEPHGYAKDIDIKKNYYLLSMGGNHVGDRMRKLYDTLCRYYTEELWINPYPHSQKSKELKERIAI